MKIPRNHWKRRISLREAFEARFSPEPMSGCWLWLGPTLYNERAYFCHDMRETTAARFAWEIYRGPLPEGAHVFHCCDNPWCVNPDHLFLGDQRANMLDAQAKGRQRHDPVTGRFMEINSA